MKNLGAKLKTFGKAVLQKLVVKAVAGLLMLLILMGFAYLKRSVIRSYIIALYVWLDAEHTIRGSGWRLVSYFSLPFLIPFLSVIICRFCFRSRNSRKPSSGKRVVVSILAQWVIDNQDILSKGKVVQFRPLDEQNNLKNGSARKYLKKIVDNHKTLCIVHLTKETALIKAREY